MFKCPNQKLYMFVEIPVFSENFQGNLSTTWQIKGAMETNLKNIKYFLNRISPVRILDLWLYNISDPHTLYLGYYYYKTICDDDEILTWDPIIYLYITCLFNFSTACIFFISRSRAFYRKYRHHLWMVLTFRS